MILLEKEKLEKDKRQRSANSLKKGEDGFLFEIRYCHEKK